MADGAAATAGRRGCAGGGIGEGGRENRDWSGTGRLVGRGGRNWRCTGRLVGRGARRDCSRTEESI